MSKFKTRYDRRKVSFETTEPSMTIQSDLPGTLIPNILAQHGVVPPREVMFGDFTNVPSDYAELQRFMSDANEQFMTLPSDVRDRFDHDVGQLLAFLQNPANRPEAVKLGLVKPPDVSPAPPAAPAAEAGSTESSN